MFVSSKEDIDISIKGKLYQDFQITPWEKDIQAYKGDQITDLLKIILLSYQKKDIELLKSLYTKETQKEFKKIPKELKQKRLDFYANVKSAFLKYIIKYEKGYIAYWITDNKRQLKHFITTENKMFKLAPLKLEANEKTKYIDYLDIYVMYAPFILNPAIMLENKVEIKSDTNGIIKFDLKKKNNWITIFNKPEKIQDKPAKIMLQDNDTQNRFKDGNPEAGSIFLELAAKNIRKKGETILYAIESTYPIGKITPELYKKASKLTITKK